LLKLHFVKIVNYGTSVCDLFGGNVAAYISRSVMSNSVSSIVLTGFKKIKKNCIENGWTYTGCCVYVALFRSKLSQGMHNRLCDWLG